MGEVVNVLVAFAVIVFVVRWATSDKNAAADPNSPAAILGFKPKTVTQEQECVDALHNMFPDIPSDNIRYDLLRTGSPQVTSNKILERGFLPAPPPAYYRVYPRTDQAGAPRAALNNAQAAGSSSAPKENLIKRFNLENRVAESSGASAAAEEPLHRWEDAPERREASLRERKARMVLAARERLLAQERQKQQAASSSSSA